MAEATARAILALGRGQSSGYYLVDHGEEFLYDCDEDAAYAWNQHSGGLPEAVQGDYDEGVITFYYRGRERPLRLRHNRGDGLLQMHALAMLVREDSELRICLDSVGNSELAFLPLPPKVWAALEQEFGQELVDYRFMRLPEDVDAIEPALEALHVLSREYPDDDTPPPPRDPRNLACDAALVTLQGLLEPDYPQILLGWETTSDAKSFSMSLFVKTQTDADMERLRADEAGLRRLLPVLRELCLQVQGGFGGFRYASEERRQRIIRERTGELLGGPREFPAWWNKPASAPVQPAPAATPAPDSLPREIPALGEAAQARRVAWGRAEPVLRQLLAAGYPDIFLGYGQFSIRASRAEGMVLYLITPTAAALNTLRADEALLRRLRPTVQAWCRDQGQDFLGFSFGSDDSSAGLLPVDGGKRSGGWPELPAWWNTPDAVNKPALSLVPIDAAPPGGAPAASPGTPVNPAAPVTPAAAVAQQAGTVAKPVAKVVAAATAATPAARAPAPKPLPPPPLGGMQVLCPNCQTRFNVRPTAVAQPLLGAVLADCPGCGWRINLGFTSLTRALIWLPVLFFLGLNLIGSNAVAHVIATLLAGVFGWPLVMERKLRQRIVKRG